MKIVTHTRQFLEISDLKTMNPDDEIIVNRILLNSKVVRLGIQDKNSSEEYSIVSQALSELTKREGNIKGILWGIEMKVKDILLVFGDDELSVTAFREKKDYSSKKKMSELARIKKSIIYLEQEKLRAEQIIASSKEMIEQKNIEMAEYYQKFFDSKRNTEFVLYDRFPSADVLAMYVRKITSEFPLYEYGNLNVKELAELIKQCYQFQRGTEYDILTIGANELEGSPVYGGQSWSVNPHLYFMVGNDKTLEPYREYNGQYVNSDKLHSLMYLNARGKDLISIELESGYDKPAIDIECLTGDYGDMSGMINYYNEASRRYRDCTFAKFKNIYDRNLRNKTGKKGRYGYTGIKDVLDFNVHILDTFIARILVSVSIYKKNNNIEKLTNEDYIHIFDVLYGEKVDVVAQSEIDIPKKLIYVPNWETKK